MLAVRPKAERFLRKVLKAVHNQTPRVINVDKNAAYPPAIDSQNERPSSSVKLLNYDP